MRAKWLESTFMHGLVGQVVVAVFLVVVRQRLLVDSQARAVMTSRGKSEIELVSFAQVLPGLHVRL